MRTENQSDRVTDLLLSADDRYILSLSFSSVVQEGDALSACTGVFRAEG